MLEKMKKWNWKLITSVLLCIAWFVLLVLVSDSLSDPVYDSLWADGVTTDAELYGFTVALTAFILGFFMHRFWKTMDMIPWKRRKK